MTLIYPLALTPQEEGVFLITSRDISGLVSECDTLEDAFRQGQGALTAMLSAMIDDGETIPPASPAEEGEILIPLSGQIQQKVLIYLRMREKGWRAADLARAMKTDHKSVRRLLDPCHNSLPRQIDQAIWALGCSAEITLRPTKGAESLVAPPPT